VTLFAYLAGSDIGHKVRLNAFGLTSNADGSVGMGGIIFDDHDGSLTVRGWMKVVVKELACAAAPVLFSGYVGPRTYSRNGESQFRTGVSRWIDTTLVDENAVTHIRLITGADGKRDAETHNERIDWLLASTYMDGLIDDTSLVDTSFPRPFQEADYRGQYADDVLMDISAPIFRIWFIYPTQPDGGRGLFFDSPTVAIGDSTLSISNVVTDLSSTCFPPSIDATLSSDPSEVYAKVRYTYSHGVVIENDSGTAATFFTDNGLGYRGLQIDNSRVGIESTARNMADNILDRDDSENDTISVTVQLPAASVGLVQAGQRIQVKFSHLPGYTAFTWTRVTSVNVRQSQGTTDLYDVSLDLNNHGSSGGGGGGAPAPGAFPHPPAAGGIVQSVSGASSLTLPSPATAGNTLVYAGGKRSAVFNKLSGLLGFTTCPDGQMSDGPDFGGIFYKLAVGGETTLSIAGEGLDVTGTWYELVGEVTPRAHASTTGSNLTPTVGPVTAPAGAVTIAVAIQGTGGVYDAMLPFTYTPGAGWSEDADTNTAAGHPTVWTGNRTDAGSLTASATKSVGGSGMDLDWAMQVVVFVGADNPPAPAQEVPWTVVTMTPSGGVSVGVAPFPYADGSLLVRVDGIQITAASYVESDGATGGFALAWLLDGDETVTVKILGR
jgi:hypothetical protein